MVSQQTNARKHTKVHYAQCMPPTCVAISKKVHYKGQIHQNITEVSEPKYRYKILNFKNNTCLKYILRIKTDKNICD